MYITLCETALFFTGKSLKHLKSGKCVHPSARWPAIDKELKIYSGCDLTRLQIWFMKQGRYCQPQMNVNRIMNVYLIHRSSYFEL